jgi:hypothetical protein
MREEGLQPLVHLKIGAAIDDIFHVGAFNKRDLKSDFNNNRRTPAWSEGVHCFHLQDKLSNDVSNKLLFITDIISSTLKVSAAGTSSSRVLEQTTRPTFSNRRKRCTLTPLVEASPGKFTGLKNLISLQ